jgi:hypothetical protein
MKENKEKINCPAFQKQESIIRDITDKINKAKGVQEKAMYADELLREVDVLLSCANFDRKRLDCKHCHFVSNLREKTANLIIKAKKLA